MVVVIGILMLAIAVFAIAYPLFRNPSSLSQPPDALSDEGLAELVARRDATYVALRELDMDYEMGKLMQADYQALRDRYRAQGVAILQKLDSRQEEAEGADEDHTLDQEVDGRLYPGGRSDVP